MVEVDMYNNGNTHERPVGTLTVTDPESGDALHTLEINEFKYPIYPQGMRKLIARDENVELDSGNYQLSVEIPYYGETLTMTEDIEIP